MHYIIKSLFLLQNQGTLNCNWLLSNFQETKLNIFLFSIFNSQRGTENNTAN